MTFPNICCIIKNNYAKYFLVDTFGYGVKGDVVMMCPCNLHQLMVIALVRKFNEDGLTIEGASYFRGFDLPPKLGKHNPDVIAISPDGTFHIGEAKLEENLDTQKTFEQFSDFLNTKSPSNKATQLHIIVVAPMEEKLRALLNKWHFTDNPNIHIWTY